MTNVNAILACDDGWGVGKNNSLPWPRNDYDMKWFRDNTNKGIVVMGRKTWESIGSRPLPNRTNIVITSQDLMYNEGDKPSATWSGNMVDCINYLKSTHIDRKIWIIGGADIYRQSVPYCDHVYLTKIEGRYDCDAFFDPNLLNNFTRGASVNKPGCEFSIWRRI